MELREILAAAARNMGYTPSSPVQVDPAAERAAFNVYVQTVVDTPRKGATRDQLNALIGAGSEWVRAACPDDPNITNTAQVCEPQNMPHVNRGCGIAMGTVATDSESHEGMPPDPPQAVLCRNLHAPGWK